MRRNRVIPIVVAIAICTSRDSAQTQVPSTRIKTTVSAATIEIEVRDPSGNPVADLGPADFIVTEAGERRAVISAEYLRAHSDIVPRAVADAPVDITTNREVDSAGAVLFVLDDSTPMPAADGPRLVQLVSEAIRRVPSSERLGVSFASNRNLNVEFSRDRARSLAAAQKFRARADIASVIAGSDSVAAANSAAFAVMDESSETLYRATIRAIRDAVAAIAMQPSRRRSLVLFSAGLPLSFADQSASAPLARRLAEEFTAAVDAAKAADVAIHVVDSGGLRADFGSVRSLAGQEAPGGSGRLNREFLISLAASTGGVAAVGTNDPLGTLDRAMTAAGSFYLVRYESASFGTEGVRDPLAVRTTRAGAAARIRHPTAPTHQTTTALSNALQHLVSDVPLDLALIPAPGRAGSSALIAVVQVHRSTVGESLARRERFTLVVSADGADGKPAASRTSRIDTTLPGNSDDVRFDVITQLELPPGWYFVRAAIEADHAPEVGSVSGDAVVPSFRGKDAELSGLSLSVSPAPMSGPKSALDGLRIPTPTAHRIFHTTEDLTATVLVSNDSRELPRGVDLEYQLLSEDGARLSGQTQHFGATELAAGMARAEFQAHLSDLKPGRYWIAVSLVSPAGRAIRRATCFELR